MTSCPLENGCLDNWTWTDDPRPCVVSDDTTAFCDRVSFVLPSLRPRTLRGTKMLNSDAHYWEMKLNRVDIFALNVHVGIVGRGKPLSPDRELASRDRIRTQDQKPERWGLSSKGYLYPKHHARVQGTYSQVFPRQTVIGLLLDRREGTLSYYQDGVPLGVAFTIPNYLDYELFPAVWNINTRTYLKIGRRLMSLNNLQERCRATIVEELSEKTDIDLLNLPTTIKDYLYDGYYEKQKSDMGQQYLSHSDTLFDKPRENGYYFLLRGEPFFYMCSCFIAIILLFIHVANVILTIYI